MWATQDTIKRQRMNRSHIVGRLLIPMLDSDQSDVVDVTPIAVDGTSVTTSESTPYTVAASVFSIVQRITLTNIHTAARNAQVHLVVSGGSRTVANRIFSDTVEAGETVVIEGPWFLATGDMIKAISSDATGTQLSIRADVLTLAAQDGFALNVTQGAALTAALATYYTVPSTGVTKALLLHVWLCNTDTVARDVDVHLVPNGGSASAANQIFNDTLQAGESVAIVGPFVMDPSDFIRAIASSASIVSIRPTVLEVA